MVNKNSALGKLSDEQRDEIKRLLSSGAGEKLTYRIMNKKYVGMEYIFHNAIKNMKKIIGIVGWESRFLSKIDSAIVRGMNMTSKASRRLYELEKDIQKQKRKMNQGARLISIGIAVKIKTFGIIPCDESMAVIKLRD